MIGGIGLVYLVVHFAGLEEGVLSGITLNTVNFMFLFIGILLHGTPASLLKQAERGGSFVWGIIIQFPFYAGILGIITATGFSERIAGWFTAIANEHTFPLVTYWYSGLVNLFVPSGGSKFVIEAPYIAEAAQSLGVSPELTGAGLRLGRHGDRRDPTLLGAAATGDRPPRFPRRGGISAHLVFRLRRCGLGRVPARAILLLPTGPPPAALSGAPSAATAPKPLLGRLAFHVRGG